MRYMFLIRTDSAAAPTPALMEAMHALAQQEVKAGRMISDGGLAPPAAGRQLRLDGGKIVVMDGPFTETKEVLGGFAVFELPDIAAAEASARTFLDLHRKHAPDWRGTCEIRVIAGSQVEMIRGAG
jgi:hypothetical protein